MTDTPDQDAPPQEIVVHLRGQESPLLIRGEDLDVVFEALMEHLRGHGFTGWRRCKHMALNMAEVQAVFIRSLDSQETTHD